MSTPLFLGSYLIAGHVVGSRPIKRKKHLHLMINTFFGSSPSPTLSLLYYKILCLYFLVTINFISVLCFVVAEGEKLEKEMNDKGPGEACLIKCDVTKEEDIKVSVLCFLETLQSEVIIIYLPTFSEM